MLFSLFFFISYLHHGGTYPPEDNQTINYKELDPNVVYSLCGIFIGLIAVVLIALAISQHFCSDDSTVNSLSKDK